MASCWIKKGLLCSDPINHRIALCSDCYNSLKKPAMPRYALANNLYRGHLPTEFCDLTWVEEMACAIYHITAHVTCLYGFSEPGQPKIFHGNTITRDMNVISTTTVLPRTPADITGYLPVVSIGPHKIKASDLGNTFRVQKAKIWHFLLWLKHPNRLYEQILLDQSNIDQFPDDGVLPGVDAQFIQDIHQKSDEIFQEETAGFTEHPAEAFMHDNSKHADDQPTVLLEHTGVSDPEGDSISIQ
ncbi:uncharacterized protein C8Q71DRAFT_710536 [Rhodofomes roseus]|uniref:DUF6570 domain-containing protein n=1 Tax=Rhodofomes roseus TaxID=34475 RepID=A0ABQ8KC69_9APHY|nr:uncharacterized protein C8Q71DRAFT_710536 [Rhodofomes roseus]KAH9834902.1 hypothetical protein C8Q71DRAFT_710536 [Rhodofomes roseus]